MFEFFKNLFVSKQSEDGDVFPQEPVAAHAQAVSSGPAPARSRQPAHQGGVRPASQDQSSSAIDLPLQTVLNGMPLELKGRIQQLDVGDATISIPLDKILSQLPLGTVKLSFGELRRAGPQLFSQATDCDQIPVALPLHEILTRINPSMLVRRQNQKQVEVPEEISSPFGERGLGLIVSVGPSKTPPAAARAITPAAPAPPRPEPAKNVPPPQVHLRPGSIKPGPPASAAPAPSEPFLPLPPRHGVTPPRSPLPGIVPPTVTPKSAPVPGPAPHIPSSPPQALPIAASLRNFNPALSPGMPPPVRAVASPAAKPVAEPVFLNVPLAAVVESWSETLRQEIVELNLIDAKLALPADIIEDALKRGKAAFPWKTVRSWIRPAPLPTVSAHDGSVVELPLKVILPSFLSRKKDGLKSKHKVEIDESIPNLFFGFPQPESPGAEVAHAEHPAVPRPAHPAPPASTDTNYYIWDDNSESARVDESDVKRRIPGGTEFATKYATPNEIVSRAAALEGVAGALVALPDGLMVASKLSGDLNGDTLAAFLPQIFGKVSQCTKELRMGELNNLNFTVGNVPWKIFRVNAIFFAAFGRVGQPLPTAQLAELAAELDHKK